MPEPKDSWRVRLDMPNGRREDLRRLAFESRMSMAEYCRSLVLEGLDRKRVLKPKKEKK